MEVEDVGVGGVVLGAEGVEVGLYFTGDSFSRKARSSGSRLRRGSVAEDVDP